MTFVCIDVRNSNFNEKIQFVITLSFRKIECDNFLTLKIDNKYTSNILIYSCLNVL